jgi:hypothetical protein
MNMSQPKSIPAVARPAYEAVIAITDTVCRGHLNEEWAALCRDLAAALARKRPSPLLRGQPEIWSAGILHALGMVNFLFDRSQTPSMSVGELSDACGVKQSTMGTKSKLIRDLFKMYQFDPKWTLPSKMDQNPYVWMISVNGLLMDARYAPPEIQAEAYRLGVIPYISGQAEDD